MQMVPEGSESIFDGKVRTRPLRETCENCADAVALCGFGNARMSLQIYSLGCATTASRLGHRLKAVCETHWVQCMSLLFRSSRGSSAVETVEAESLSTLTLPRINTRESHGKPVCHSCSNLGGCYEGGTCRDMIVLSTEENMKTSKIRGFCPKKCLVSAYARKNCLVEKDIV